LLKERKFGDPRTDSGCKEFDRSMTIGDSGTAVIDAAGGRRAICVSNPKSEGREQTRRSERKSHYVSRRGHSGRGSWEGNETKIL
jgi:hypothetical protein